MSRYTRLERAVMAALAHDLRVETPDLAGQFEDSRPSQRRNSGFGLFTEMVVDRNRPPPPFGPSGDLGSVHVMVGSLSDPIAFKARLRNGVLLGLFGDSYGQDTRAIDFATVPFDQVFTVNDQGISIPFEPSLETRPVPVAPPDRRRTPGPPATAETPLRNVGALQRVQDVDAPAPHLGKPEVVAPISPDQTSLLIGLWVLIGVVAVILVAVFRLPIAFGIFFTILVGRAVKDPKVLGRVREVVNDWQASAGQSPKA